jgi:hypothetical protein
MTKKTIKEKKEAKRERIKCILDFQEKFIEGKTNTKTYKNKKHRLKRNRRKIRKREVKNKKIEQLKKMKDSLLKLKLNARKSRLKPMSKKEKEKAMQDIILNDENFLKYLFQEKLKEKEAYEAANAVGV